MISAKIEQGKSEGYDGSELEERMRGLIQK